MYDRNRLFSSDRLQQLQTFVFEFGIQRNDALIRLGEFRGQARVLQPRRQRDADAVLSMSAVSLLSVFMVISRTTNTDTSSVLRA